VSLHDGRGVIQPITSATHITGGSYTVPLESLAHVYGKGKCYGCLMSIRTGNSRLLMCSSPGAPGHESASSRAHQLPRHSGPLHEPTWSLVLAHAASLEADMEDFTARVLSPGKQKRRRPKPNKNKAEGKKPQKSKK
jgi:hypothetical protein